MKSNGKKAVVAGHICIDLTPEFPQSKIQDISLVLNPGKVIHMNGIDIHTGGAVANTGLAMKKLGCDVSLMGKIGDDYFGSLILHILDNYDVGKEMIVSKKAATSYSIVLAMPGIDRIFLHDSGANDTFTSEDVDWNIVKEASLFHFGYPSLMKQLYQDDGEGLVALFSKVKEFKVATSLDLAVVDANSEAAKVDWDSIFKKVLPFVDFFVPSIEELGFMLDRERYDGWIQKADGKDVTHVITMQDLRFLGEKALNYGAKVILIKCGAFGMYYKTTSQEKMKELCENLSISITDWANKEGFEASYIPDAVISGTGAGDTSIAAFLTSVLEESSLENALHMATATGACCVSAYDALSGIRPLEELREKINDGWEKTEHIPMYSVKKESN